MANFLPKNIFSNIPDIIDIIMKKNILFIGIIVVLLGAFLIISKGPEVATENPIKIGAVLSLTGPAAPFGEINREALLLAEEEINKKGGIDGRMVEIYIEDDETSGAKAATAFQKLVDVENVDVVIGGVWDFLAQSIMPLAESRGVVFITPSNFLIPEVFEPNKETFLMMPEFEFAIRKLEGEIAQSGAEKLALVRFTSSFGAEIGRVLGEITSELGYAPLVTETYQAIGGNDYRTTIAKLKAGGIDGVYLDMIGSDTVTFLKQAKEMEFNPKIFTHLGAVEDFVINGELDKSLLENAVVLDWEVSSDEFDELFEEKYGHVPGKSANRTYDAVYAAAEAVAKRSSNETIVQYLEDNKFETLNGVFSFNDSHIVDQIETAVYVVKGGEFVLK